eukprot:gene1006-1364_t
MPAAGPHPAIAPETRHASLDDPALATALRSLLRATAAYGASDLHFSTGARPFVRKNRAFSYLSNYALTAAEALRLNTVLLSEGQKKTFLDRKDYDYALALSATDRYRVNLMFHKNGAAGSYRMVPEKVRSLKDLGFAIRTSLGRGRPRKKRQPQRPLPNEVRIAERMLAESRRPVKIRENGKVEEIPMIDAVMRSVGAKAVQGDPRAGAAYIQLTDRAEATIIKEWNAVVDGVMEYKAGWREEFEACDRRRVPRPEPVPHPDEITIDHAAMEIRYNGPTSEDQARRWEEQCKDARKTRRDIREMQAELRGVEPDLRAFYEEEIAWMLASV